MTVHQQCSQALPSSLLCKLCLQVTICCPQACFSSLPTSVVNRTAAIIKIFNWQCVSCRICTAVQARSNQARGKVQDIEDKVSVHMARLLGCQEELVGLQDQVKAAHQAADLVLITACIGSAHV